MLEIAGKYGEWLEREGLTRIEGWAMEGLTDGAIARRMGVAASTLSEWKERFPQIDGAIRQGRAPVNVEAEKALLRCALGYTVSVRKPLKVREVTQKNGEGRTEVERVEYAEEEIHVPPKINALAYWLKNRRPDRWSDRPRGDDIGDDPLVELLRRWDGE